MIVQCLVDNILEIVKYKKSAKDMIKELKGTYEQKKIAKEVNLQRKLRNLIYTRTG